MRFKEFNETTAVASQVLKSLGFDSPEPTYSADKLMGIDKPDTDTSTVKQPTDVPSGLPVKGPITSPFGMRARGMHNGTDFGVPVGTPVVAPDDGVVFQSGPAGDAGIMVSINSGSAQHKLMHLSQTKVRPGEKVKKGQVVGLSGNTGLSTGPHLHWSKHVASGPVDPMRNVG
jgi:murein DD-endopeptidase MepM/ murein hydrolase activator NlpD